MLPPVGNRPPKKDKSRVQPLPTLSSVELTTVIVVDSTADTCVVAVLSALSAGVNAVGSVDVTVLGAGRSTGVAGASAGRSVWVTNAVAGGPPRPAKGGGASGRFLRRGPPP